MNKVDIKIIKIFFFISSPKKFYSGLFLYINKFIRHFSHNLLLYLICKKGDGIIELKLIGSNCSNGRRLKKIIERVCLQNHFEVTLNELNNKSDQKKYNVNMIPALVLDDKIISQGKILSDKEIKKLILSTVTN